MIIIIKQVFIYTQEFYFIICIFAITLDFFFTMAQTFVRLFHSGETCGRTNILSQNLFKTLLLKAFFFKLSNLLCTLESVWLICTTKMLVLKFLKHYQYLNLKFLSGQRLTLPHLSVKACALILCS